MGTGHASFRSTGVHKSMSGSEESTDDVRRALHIGLTTTFVENETEHSAGATRTDVEQHQRRRSVRLSNPISNTASDSSPLYAAIVENRILPRS